MRCGQFIGGACGARTILEAIVIHHDDSTFDKARVEKLEAVASGHVQVHVNVYKAKLTFGYFPEPFRDPACQHLDFVETREIVPQYCFTCAQVSGSSWHHVCSAAVVGYIGGGQSLKRIEQVQSSVGRGLGNEECRCADVTTIFCEVTDSG